MTKNGWEIASEFTIHSSSEKKAISFALKEMEVPYDKYECYPITIIELD
jgi:hypothetical protein